VIAVRIISLVTSACDLAFSRRLGPGAAVAEEAVRLARACHEMALRFSRGGKLIAFGTGGGAADAAHLAVEFVHPVVVGKRALPAIPLANDTTFAAQLRLLGRETDIAVGVAAGPDRAKTRAGLAAAGEAGMLTVALTTTGEQPALGGVRHVLAARTEDPRVAREIHMTMYHILWELVHVFLDGVHGKPGPTDGAA
jgi:D-sedoheptulose 7-phosphate isomerase